MNYQSTLYNFIPHITILSVAFGLMNCTEQPRNDQNTKGAIEVMQQEAISDKHTENISFSVPSTITLSLKNFPKLDRHIKFSGRYDVYQETGEMSYFDGSDFRDIDLGNYPVSKTIQIPSTSNYLILRCRYNFFSYFDYLVQEGDSLILSVKKGFPYLEISNRNIKEFDVNVDYYITTKYIKDKYSANVKYTNPIMFLPHAENSPEKNKPLIKKLRGRLAAQAMDLLTKTDKDLDSLRDVNKVSEKVYLFFKARTYSQRQQLATAEAKIDINQIKSILQYKWLTPQLPLFYHQQMLETISDHHYTDKVDKLDLKDGVNRDYRAVYKQIKASTVFPKNDKNWLLTREFRRIANTFSKDDFDRFYALFKQDVQDSTLQQAIRQEYALQLIPQTNNQTEVTLVNHDQTMTTLSDVLKRHKGKVVYVDFWASWCAPCREGMKHSIPLQKELADKKIAFVYLSIDKTIIPWQKASEKESLTNYQESYLLTESEGSKKFWAEQKISAIPRYMIFDKVGKLIYANAPNVESKEIKPLLLKLAQ